MSFVSPSLIGLITQRSDVVRSVFIVAMLSSSTFQMISLTVALSGVTVTGNLYVPSVATDTSSPNVIDVTGT